MSNAHIRNMDVFTPYKVLDGHGRRALLRACVPLWPPIFRSVFLGLARVHCASPSPLDLSRKT
eukprot:463730-Prorocentrum_minimum.AAC.5